MRGEELARRHLHREDYQVIHNPIVPHPAKAGQFLETDAIVYGEGSLFCVEVKRYRGWLHWSYAGNGKRELLQRKPGNYGEAVFDHRHPDPLARTKSYINNLKRHLSGVDERFGRLYFILVVAFVTEDCEIGGVHDFEGGYIALAELEAFISNSRNEQFAGRKSRWIVEGLSGLAGWDRVITRGGAEHYGVLGGEGVTLLDGSGGKRFVRYDELQELRVGRGGAFSAADEVEAFTAGGSRLDLRSAFSVVELESFDRRHGHRLRDVSRVIVGTRRLRAGAGGPLL